MQQFIGILEQESKGKYSSPSSPYSHPYLRKLNNCLRDCNISGDHVKEWIHILTQHFQQSNRLGLPSIKPAATAEYRCLQDQIDDANELQYKVMADVHLLLTEQIQQRRLMHKILTAQEETNSHLRALRAIGSTTDSTTDLPKQVQAPLESIMDCKMWPHFLQSMMDSKVSYANKFFLYYSSDVEAYYKYREVKSKADRNAKNSIKFLMEQMLLNDEIPEKSNYTTVEEWNQELRVLGQRAEAALFRKLEVDAAPAFSTVVAKLRKATEKDSDNKKRKRT